MKLCSSKPRMKVRLLISLTVLVAIIVLAGAGVWLSSPSVSPGELSIVDGSQSGIEIPDDVREDAISLASQFFGGNSTGYEKFVNDLLQVYSEAGGRDFLLIFNSGGLGQEEIGPEWGSIVEGIEEELGKLGYTTLLVIYARTVDGLWASMNEIRETIHLYPSKAKPLAAVIDFITEHIDNINVILMGESSGAIFANEVMGLLEANPRVYSIQTGVPFAYHGAVSERSLVINDNGIIPDTLVRCDLWAIFQANIGHIPTYRPQEGHLFFYIRAPGHIYTWDHPGVRSQITSFLREHFAGE